MEIITPSYRPDFELCRDLNRSVLEYTTDDVRHRIFVSRRDVALFSALESERTDIVCTADLLPRTLFEVPRLNYSVNLRRPFPPIRGWMRQQLVKLAGAAASSADVAVLIDSDLEFVRPFTVDTFMRDGIVRLYRWPGHIDERLPRHVAWHHVARDLLGLPQASTPLNDYISSPLAWSPGLVRQLLARVEAVSGRSWTGAIGGVMHFSEVTLYGLFVDEYLGAPANTFSSDDSLMHGYWGNTPIDEVDTAAFVTGISPTDVAVMISAKSNTPLPQRRAAIAELRRALPARG
jgi:hypothetical protein